MGKGSRRRPLAISRAEFDRNWEAAFGGKDEGSRMKDEGTPHTPCAVRGAGKPLNPVAGDGLSKEQA